VTETVAQRYCAVHVRSAIMADIEVNVHRQGERSFHARMPRTVLSNSILSEYRLQIELTLETLTVRALVKFDLQPLIFNVCHYSERRPYLNNWLAKQRDFMLSADAEI
jgi:hypothetical protein